MGFANNISEGDLGTTAAAEMAEQIIVEWGTQSFDGTPSSDVAERIKAGFIQFKKQKEKYNKNPILYGDSCKAGKLDQLKRPVNEDGNVPTGIEVVNGNQHCQRNQENDSNDAMEVGQIKKRNADDLILVIGN